MSSFRAFPGPALMRYNDFTTAEWHPVWWPARSSKPLFGVDLVLGGFDSHAAPPSFSCGGFRLLSACASIVLGVAQAVLPSVCKHSSCTTLSCSDTYFPQRLRYTVETLVSKIELGEIGLPDIQRPFIWPNKKVRDLFDSMYNGFPVGYLLFWQSVVDGQAKMIGTGHKQKPSSLLIVDGQQRLTSLYAVLGGVPVVGKDYEEEKIEIAFNPLSQKFEVADAAIRKDKSFISNISVLWRDDSDLFEVVDSYLEGLKDHELTTEDEKRIKKSITRLYGLTSFPFTALELASDLDAEQVAEVFTRINSKGVPLKQADFILTLMSVFWDEGRKELESFARVSRKPAQDEPSPYNHYISPDPDQLLRVAISLGFKRARLSSVYSVLRGKDLHTGEFSPVRREEQFEILRNAQSEALNLVYWHDFFKAVRLAGCMRDQMITSKNALIYSYVFYLIGRIEYEVSEHELRQLMARWFFMASMTGRYSSSPESAMEYDLARLRDVGGPKDFVRTLGRVCEDTLTHDYWTITLPNNLATSAARSPTLFAYYAALILLDTKVLFSEQKVSDLLDPALKGPKAFAERHHLFPRGYLEKLGVTDTYRTNQIANYALVEWGDNAQISDKAPADYLPQFLERFGSKELERMYYWHALPDGWQNMEYAEFLEARRELMASVIKDAYRRLAAPTQEDQDVGLVDVDELLAAGEGDATEFKSTLRMNLHTGEP